MIVGHFGLRVGLKAAGGDVYLSISADGHQLDLFLVFKVLHQLAQPGGKIHRAVRGIAGQQRVHGIGAGEEILAGAVVVKGADPDGYRQHKNRN